MKRVGDLHLTVFKTAALSVAQFVRGIESPLCQFSSLCKDHIKRFP